MSFNACGDCTACCERFEIDGDIWNNNVKTKNVMCKYECNGCSIYEDRPEVCRDFKCVWLRIKEARPDFSEQLRPDQVGAMVITKEPENNKGQILIDECIKGAFDVNSMTDAQAELVTEIATLASRQDIPTSLYFRTYNWEMKKINIQMEQTIT